MVFCFSVNRPPVLNLAQDLSFFFFYKLEIFSELFRGASQVAQVGKNPPAMQETPVRSLGWEDSLEEEVAAYSSIPAWKVPQTGQPGGL